jgi:hypothetical protein
MGISVGRRILGGREYSGGVEYVVFESFKKIAGQRLSHYIG